MLRDRGGGDGVDLEGGRDYLHARRSISRSQSRDTLDRENFKRTEPKSRILLRIERCIDERRIRRVDFSRKNPFHQLDDEIIIRRSLQLRTLEFYHWTDYK